MTLYLLRLMVGQRAATAEEIHKDTFEGVRLYAQLDFLNRFTPNGIAKESLKVDILHKPDPDFLQWVAIARGQYVLGKWTWFYPPDPD